MFLKNSFFFNINVKILVFAIIALIMTDLNVAKILIFFYSKIFFNNLK